MRLKDWLSKEYLNLEGFKKKFVSSKPFSYLELNGFLRKEKAVKVLKALLIERFYQKEADLFKFKQTCDLKHTQNKDLKDFIGFLYS